MGDKERRKARLCEMLSEPKCWLKKANSRKPYRLSLQLAWLTRVEPTCRP